MAAPGDRLRLERPLPKRDETTTVGEFLSKPNRAVTRGELAAFIETIVVGKVAPLIGEAIRRNNLEWEKRLEAALKAHDEAKKKEAPVLWTPGP